MASTTGSCPPLPCFYPAALPCFRSAPLPLPALRALQFAALRDHLAESRAERGQLGHYRAISRQLEEAKARVEEELLSTAQLVTKLEARLRDLHGKVGLPSGRSTAWLRTGSAGGGAGRSAPAILLGWLAQG
jgi:hypothetical protein